MNKRLIIAVVVSLMISMMSVFAITVDTVDVDVAAPSDATESSQTAVAAQGGNTTYVNLTSNSNTQNWQGFYGDITGSLRLGDGANILYDFGATSFQAVFASSNNSVNFGTVTGLGAVPAQAAADTFFGFAAGVDNVTTVVNDAGACTAGTEIAAAGGITTLNSTGGNWGEDTCFAGTIPAPTGVDDYIWGSDIVSAGAASFVAGLSVEYQLMVPVSAAGDLFYFYLEI